MRKPSRGFEFPLPFDPFRLLLAVLENLLWILLAVIVLGGLAASVGWFYLGDSFKAPVRLQKEAAPDGWQDNPAGPYMPRPLGAEALKIIAYSNDVFELAGEKHEPKLDADTMRERVLFEEITGQDLFEVRGLSKKDAAEALGFATAYADALMEITTERRKAAASEAFVLYSAHLEQRREAAARVSKQLLEVASKNGVFDPSGQTGSRLLEMTNLRAKQREAENAVEAAKGAVSLYLGQQWLAPMRAELARINRSQGANSAEARERARQLEKIETSLPALTSVDGDATVRGLAGMLPAVVYKEVIRLRENLKVEQAKLDGAVRQVAEGDVKMAEMPDKVMAVSDLQTNLREKLAATVLLEARMKDAEFYAKTPPPPLQHLNTPTDGEVLHRTALSKAMILGGAGAVLGGVLALGLVLLIEFFRRTVRTPLQAAIATSAVPKLSYPRASKSRGQAELRDFWLRSVGRFLPEERRFLFPVLGDTTGEEKFWEDLFGSLDGGPYRVVFMDFGRQPLKLGGGGRNMLPDYDFKEPHPVSVIDPSQFNAGQIDKICAELPERHILLVRWERDPDTTLAELCRHMDRYYFVTSGRDARAAEVEYLSGVYRDLLGEADGVVLVERRTPGRARRIVSAIESWFISSRERDAERMSAKPELGGAAL